MSHESLANAMTLHELIADKLERADLASREALLRIPLENIDRWLANGHTAPHRLEQWRQIILRSQRFPEGFQELLAALRDPGEAAQRLRDFAPFAGLLTRDERRQADSECAYHFEGICWIPFQHWPVRDASWCSDRVLFCRSTRTRWAGPAVGGGRVADGRPGKGFGTAPGDACHRRLG